MTDLHAVPEPDASPSVEQLSWQRAGYDNRTWRRSAACLQLDQDMFFASGSTATALEQIDRAKAVCAGCPVRLACLQFALTTNQDFGVWGGYDEDERLQLRRDWRLARKTAQPRARSGTAERRSASSLLPG